MKSVPSPRPACGSRPSSHRPLTRAGAALVVLAVGGAALGGCDLHLASSPGSLPDLEGTALLRDEAARTESAAASRAESLAELATRCTDCRTTLEAVASDSTTRLAALGGVWDPWGGGTPEDAQSVAPVADAPMTPEVFISWLAATARRDLRSVSEDTSVDADDARTLASAAVGRLRSAQALAEVYDVSLDSGDSTLAVLTDRLDALLGSDTTGGWSLADPTADGDAQSGGDSPTSSASPGSTADADDASPLPSDDADVQASEQLAQAVRTWDCVAQTLPRAQVVDKTLDDASDTADVLLTRATAVLDTGVSDTRAQRCRLSDSDLGNLEDLLVSADLDLLTSDSATVRELGVRFVLEDSDLLAGGTGDALPGTTAG